MNAVVLRETKVGPEALRVEAVPDPTPGPGEVVVALEAAALNHRDVWIRKGLYPQIRLPAILGSDGAGAVAEVGEGVDPALVGRAVLIDPSLDWGPSERVQGPGFQILGMPRDGTYAQRVAVPAANVHPRSVGLSAEEAAALPLAGLTAYRAVATRARVQPGETVLVTGIGGGVSAFALQFAVALGARVFVTSGSDAKIEAARALGAAGGANYRADDWHQQIVAMADGEGPHVVIDGAGGRSLARSLEILRPGGRIATYGATTGAPERLDLFRLFWKQVDLLGTTMGSPRDFAAMLDLVARHGIRPTVDRTFPLEQAADAHRRMEQADQFGKIVLRIEA